MEEYFVYDPDYAELFGWLRQGDRLLEIPQIQGWVSPRLNIKLEMANGQLVITGANGKKFLSFVELAWERQQALETAEKFRAQLRAAGLVPQGTSRNLDPFWQQFR